MASSVHGDDMSSPLSPESFFPDVVLGAGGRQPTGIMEKTWIRVLVRGWLTTQTAAAGSPASLHGCFSAVMWEMEVIHAWYFSPRMRALMDVRALEKTTGY